MYIDPREEDIRSDPALTFVPAAGLPGEALPAGEGAPATPETPWVYAPQPGPAVPPAPPAPPARPVYTAAEPPKKAKKAKKKHTWLRVAALILVCALVGGAAGVGGALLVRRTAPVQPPAQAPAGSGTVIYEGAGTPVTVDLSKANTGKVMTYAEVYAANVNSVVGIVTESTTNIWGQRVSTASAGSGFVISADGYILTNYHVIDDATAVSVTFKDDSTYPARVVGGEEGNDVAVLKIEATGLTPVRLGSSDDLVVGEEVVAIGNPFKELTFTETHGIVSALNRPVTLEKDLVVNSIQTDCPINEGNSGGPLFNLYGQVVGITNAKYNSYSQTTIEGLCFAVPIDDVKTMIYDIIEHGYVTGKPYLGATLATVDAAAAAQYGRPGGAYVQSVVPGEAADKAGLKKGDIITAVDDEEITSYQDFLAVRDSHKAGDTVTLTVDREARTITVTLTFGEQKPADNAPSNNTPAAEIPESALQPSQDNEQNGTWGGGWGYGFDPFDLFGW